MCVNTVPPMAVIQIYKANKGGAFQYGLSCVNRWKPLCREQINETTICFFSWCCRTRVWLPKKKTCYQMVECLGTH